MTSKTTLNLDSLTDIFSFYNSVDSGISRQVNTWWNDLLSKDILIVRQIEQNLRFDEPKETYSVLSSTTKYLELVKMVYPLLVEDASSPKYNDCLNIEVLYFHASRNGNLTLMKWLKLKDNNVGTLDPSEIFLAGIDSGNLKILKWLKRTYPPAYDVGSEFANMCWSEEVWDAAADNGNLEILTWFLEIAKETPLLLWTEHAYVCAASSGHLDVLIWFKSNEVFVLENWSLWHSGVCTAAARNGHLNVLKYLRSTEIHGDLGICPWNVWTCEGAAGGGHLEVLIWLRENGCEWNSTVCSNSKSWNQRHIQDYIHSLPSGKAPCDCTTKK
jgi:hypothetical protein